MPTRPKTGAAMLCSWPSRGKSHRGRSGQAWRSRAHDCTVRQCSRSGCAQNSDARKKNENGARRCVMNVLVTIPACSHQRPERHAHRGLRDDGVPVLHVQPVPARLRQLRVVVEELEQDEPTPRAPACRDERPKSCAWAKGRLTKEKKRGDFLLQEYFRRGNYFVLQFEINSEKSTPGEITDISVVYYFKNNQTATRQICNHFCKDGNNNNNVSQNLLIYNKQRKGNKEQQAVTTPNIGREWKERDTRKRKEETRRNKGRQRERSSSNVF